jgi:hypothetical protein
MNSGVKRTEVIDRCGTGCKRLDGLSFQQMAIIEWAGIRLGRFQGVCG